MSDPIIKGAKRSSSRPASHSSSGKTSAKSRKLTVKSATHPKPIARRSASEKAPVRKATRSKTASAATTKNSRSAKQTKSAPPSRKASAKSRAATPVKRTKPTKVTAARPTSKQTKKSAPSKAIAATKTRTTGQTAPTKPAARPTATPAPPRQPTRDEAAALRSFERAHKEFVRGRFAEARNLFRALIEQHAGVAEVTARARTYLAIAEARLRSESALPRDAEALYDRGVIELNRADYVAAQELFERALKRDDKSADTHYALAATRARLGSIELALQSLGRALELKPNLRVRAQHDPDLVPLRNEPDYERLLFSPRA
jgi:tetratricopeptide (TPR) repeat protein